MRRWWVGSDGKGSTALDDWFHAFRHGPVRELLLFTDARFLMAVLAAGVVENDGAFAYPSGHTTAAVTVVGMIVLVAGAAWWGLATAAVVSVLAMVGRAVTYHYFTDTLGALLLGSAVVCVAALVSRLDRRQPGCDARHTGD